VVDEPFRSSTVI